MKVFICADSWRHIGYCHVALRAIHRLRPMFRNTPRFNRADVIVMLRESENGSEAETAFRTDAAADGKPLFIVSVYMPVVRQAAAASRTAAGAYLRELVTDRLESIVEPVGA